MHLAEINDAIAHLTPDKIFILTDSNVVNLPNSPAITLRDSLSAPLIVIKAGEENKTLSAVEHVLSTLVGEGATRRSLLICVGGGMPTDLGGFAAAIFKRGIRHINVATTILGAVDAAVGGKTGVDFMGLKNEIGAFHLPLLTLFDARSFATLPPEEILSGFGEIAKTALLDGREMTYRVLGIDPMNTTSGQMEHLCTFCRDYKMKIVEADPTEKGLRKVLNLGHTAGHAIESYLIEQHLPVAHGTAIAHGNLVSLILSNMLLGLDGSIITDYAMWLKEHYPRIPLTCRDYEDIWRIATHDKKNTTADTLNFTLLRPKQVQTFPSESTANSVKDDSDTHGHEISWTPLYDQPVTRPQFESALDIYRDLMGQ